MRFSTSSARTFPSVGYGGKEVISCSVCYQLVIDIIVSACGDADQCNRHLSLVAPLGPRDLACPWTVRGHRKENDRQPRRGVDRKSHTPHQEKQRGRNLDGKCDRKGNVGEVTLSRRPDDVKVLTSRFEIQGFCKREYPEFEFPWTFSQNMGRKVKV